MEKIKKIKCIIILTLFTLISFGQGHNLVYIDSIFPSNPTSNDSINLVIQTLLTKHPNDCGKIIDVSDSIFQQYVKVDTKFDISPSSSTRSCFRKDTLKLGVLSAGNYTLIHYWTTQDTINNVYNYRSLSDTIQLIVSSSTSLQENLNKNISLSPNPVSNFLKLNNLEKSKFDRIQLWNTKGQKIKEFKPGKSSFDLSNLPGGIYFLRLVGENQVIDKKVVKQ